METKSVSNCKEVKLEQCGHSEPAPTSAPSIHGMPVITQLWMKLN
jgi:hypothetical protein